MKKLIICLSIMLTTNVSAIEINAKAHYVAHPATGTVVSSNNENDLIGPASLTKMMTLYMLFDAIKSGDISKHSMLPISKKAWKKGGSKMFLEVGKTVKVEDLVQGIAVSSGNDACIVVAEFLGGTEEAFAEMMTEKAHDLGMSNTTFVNASGWPHKNQKTTAKDMYTLGVALFNDFPEWYSAFSQRSFTYSNIKQSNRNGLLNAGIGVDGIKTGHIDESGYHLVSSAQRGKNRLVSAVLGTKSMKSRENETAKALSLPFAQYDSFDILKVSQILEENVPVWLGEEQTVALTPTKPVSLYIPKKDYKKMKIEIKYKKPLLAPIARGAEVGTAVITTSNNTWEVPLTITKDVAEAGIFSKVKQILSFNLGF